MPAKFTRSLARMPLLVVLLAAALAACQHQLPFLPTEHEQAVLAFEFQGLRIGSPESAVGRFAQVVQLRSARRDLAVYEIFNPAPQVSTAIATFREGKLRRLELRYFDGQGIRTLARAGGWAGIRDHLIGKYGPPSRVGSEVPLATEQPGLNRSFAKFNGVWLFTRVQRQVNYIAMADAGRGVAVVTVADTTPTPTPTPAPTASPTPSGTPPTASAPAVPSPTPTPNPTPNPGF